MNNTALDDWFTAVSMAYNFSHSLAQKESHLARARAIKLAMQKEERPPGGNQTDAGRNQHTVDSSHNNHGRQTAPQGVYDETQI